MSAEGSESNGGSRDRGTPHGAVFLSYAREDAEAARRIAEALRGFGIEVWFDQNELRGGDAWDAKIKKQIRECALFVPLVSAQTQARSEGYFRREWLLAVERTRDMAAGRTFVVPVAIDGTPEAEASVPDEFMRFQWVRLADGAPTPEFVAQLKRLLEAPRKPTLKAGAPKPPTLPPHVREAAQAKAAEAAAAAAPRKSVPPIALAIALGTVAVSVGLILFVTRRSAPVPASAAVTPEPKPQAPDPKLSAKPARLSDKSIAVLPFANMSEEKENAFFADGVHEDVLTNLALIRELRVVSRTSVQTYRGTTKSVKQIAEELGVSYILEGSVRRVGNKVRVTGQLIHAATDEHVWAQTYDRDLTDIFAIQSELSQQIAGALKAALSPEEKAFIVRAPTARPEAYDAYQKGRDIRNRAPTASPTALSESEKLFQRAVDLDPEFAAAWGQLAVVHALKVFWEQDASAERKAKGDAAMARAMQLAPDAPEVIRLDGTYAYYAYRDYTRATMAYERILKLQPNDPTAYGSLALIQRRQGRWAESLVTNRRAVELDPSNISYLRALLSSLTYVRRWDEVRTARARLLQLLPGDLREELAAAYEDWKITGSFARPDALLARLTPEQRELPIVRGHRKTWAALRDDYPEFKKLYQLQPIHEDVEVPALSILFAVLMYRAHGEPAVAQREAEGLRDSLKATLATQPENFRAQLWLGVAEALLGNKATAVELARRITAVMPESRDALDGSNARYTAIEIYALVGEREEAIAQLARYLRQPGALSIHEIRTDPCLAALRGDPRYEALINDPKNNQPLL